MVNAFKNFVSSFRKGDDTKEQTLKGYGLDFIKDQKIELRLALIDEIVTNIRRGKPKYHNKQIIGYEPMQVAEQINELDHLIRVGGMVWGRAGNRPAFMEMMINWEMLLKYWFDFLSMKAEIQEENIDEQKRIERLVDNFGKREIIPFGFIILDSTFMDVDVSPQSIALVQSQIQPQFGGGGIVVPTSAIGGNQAKPNEAPIPSKLSSEIE